MGVVGMTMDKFEEFGRRIDEELTRLRTYIDKEIAPETEKRTATFLREVSEKFSQFAPSSNRALRPAPNAIHRNRLRSHDASQLVTYAWAKRQRTNLFCLQSFCFLSLACLLVVTGCASRRVTASGQPAPSPPSTASPDTIES